MGSALPPRRDTPPSPRWSAKGRRARAPKRKPGGASHCIRHCEAQYALHTHISCDTTHITTHNVQVPEVSQRWMTPNARVTTTPSTFTITLLV